MPSSGPCYLCRVLWKCAGTRNWYKCAAESEPCPLVTANAEICDTCLRTYPLAGELVNSFHLPAKVAAKRSGMSPRKFRKLCRERGIKTWPFKWFRDPIRTAIEESPWQPKAPKSDMSSKRGKGKSEVQQAAKGCLACLGRHRPHMCARQRANPSTSPESAAFVDSVVADLLQSQ